SRVCAEPPLAPRFGRASDSNWFPLLERTRAPRWLLSRLGPRQGSQSVRAGGDVLSEASSVLHIHHLPAGRPRDRGWHCVDVHTELLRLPPTKSRHRRTSTVRSSPADPR